MNYLKNLIERVPELNSLSSSLEKVTNVITSCVFSGGTIFLAGNGGSSADAEHISAELLKSFIVKRKCDDETKKFLEDKYGMDGLSLGERLEGGIKAVPLNAFAVFISAFSNDVLWDFAYAQLLYALGKEGDVFLGISCSGNAANIANAFRVAKAKRINTILLTGIDGGKCKHLADYVINAPAVETYLVQEYHSKIYHAICAQVEYNVFVS